MTKLSTLPHFALLALALLGNGAHAAPATPADVQKPAIRDCCGGGGGYEPPAGLNGWQPARRATLPLSSDARIGGDVPPAGSNGWQPAQRAALPTSGQR
jgi:hypothetical protein